jgi:hypothetical protein
VKRALQAAGLSAAGAAKKMPPYLHRGKMVQPERKLIYRWTKGEVTVPLDRLQEFAQAIEQPITLVLGPETQKEAAPDIPKRLDEIEDLLCAIAKVSGVDLARVEAMRRELHGERSQRPHGGVRQTADPSPPDG